MVVLILESVPIGLRGELSKWMLEPKAGVFVGTISGAVRDLLWEKACEEVGYGGCTMIYNNNSEQGFAIRSFGDTTRSIEEWEGLFLVRRRNPQLALAESEIESLPPVADWQEFLYPEIWAKSPNHVKLALNESDYHPLICHMIDTAMVAMRIWRYVLPQTLKEDMCTNLGVKTLDQAERWVAFFAGLHDIGKATPTFAKQWDIGWKRLVRKGYRNARSLESKRHHISSAYLLQNILVRIGLPKNVAVPISEVAGGHHGLFLSALSLQGAKRFVGSGLWEDAQLNLVRLLAHILKVDEMPMLEGDLSESNAFLIILAGLTSVSDWIASDHSLFPYVGDNVCLPDYPRRARWLAWKALHQLGWFHRPATIKTCSFQELFDKVPNKLQEQVIDIAPRLQGPSLVLLEYPMGGGKTEAALYLADYLAATEGHRGAYFALPTQATSNQMFSRVNDYLTNRFSGSAINVQLLHGHASLNAEFEVLRRTGTDLVNPVQVSEEKNARLLADEWFTYAKRGLLAPYGIGTIDQILLGVLQTKHFFVRLFGLAGKTVVLDEVHAYDTYMQTLLAHLITWLAACGTSIILLSATLPTQTRRALLDAYAIGRGQHLDKEQVITDYPRISWVTGEGVGARHIVGAKKRKVIMRFYSQADEVWVRELSEALAGGGCAAVILNTVSRAQQVYQQLKGSFKGDEVILFHARFLFGDRMKRERTVLELFGPKTDYRPYRAIVVATQVIEQSLDLDFDLMVTDLAPVDLLLQRSGRVRRHPRSSRPSGLPDSTLWVLMPGLDKDEYPDFEQGAVRVYDEHVLLRTWLALQNLDELVIPDGIEQLVESVYQEQDAPKDLPIPIRTFWNKTWLGLKEKERIDALKAQKRYIPGVTDDFFGMGMESLNDEDETLHQAHRAMTRLGGPSVSVVCLTVEGEQLWTMGQERYMVRLEKCPDIEDVMALLNSTLRISFAPGLVMQILALEPPATWQGSAHLRRYRLLKFSTDGTCLTGDLPLRLDPELGLVYITEGEEEKA